MTKFKPFANESQVVNIGRLTIENRLDRITLSGDVDLTADQTGLAQARALAAVLQEAIARLERQPDLPPNLPPAAADTAPNPFA